MNIIAAFIFFAIVGYLNAFLTLNLYDPLRTNPPLPDRGHDYFPVISLTIPNVMLIGYFVYFIIRNLAVRNLQNISKFLVCISLVFTIRLFTYTLTTYPPPLPHCESRQVGEPIVWNVLGNMFKDNDNTCLDMMFSGHASYFTLILLFIIKDSTSDIEQAINVAYYVVGLFGIIASHMHYSSDVVVGVAVTVLMAVVCGVV